MLTPRIMRIIHTMYVDTADKNYVLSRMAYFSGLEGDFYWLAMHSVEKYMKAVLLYNGFDIRGYLHDINSMYDEIISLDSRYGVESLPTVIGCRRKSAFEIRPFIKRLNEYGSADNRYMIYGYTCTIEDLLMVDHVVWSIRRHCRIPRKTINIDGKSIDIDLVDIALNSTNGWRHDNTGILEKLVDSPDSDDGRVFFKKLNFPFFPSADKNINIRSIKAVNSPLAEELHTLTNPQLSDATRQCSADNLTWALEHMKLAKNDKRLIDEAISQFRRHRSGKRNSP